MRLGQKVSGSRYVDAEIWADGSRYVYNVDRDCVDHLTDDLLDEIIEDTQKYLDGLKSFRGTRQPMHYENMK